MPDDISEHLADLAHYVGLNRAGWAEDSLHRLILAAIWRAGDSISPEAIADLVEDSLGVAIDRALVEHQIGTLRQSGRLVGQSDGRVSVSPLVRFLINFVSVLAVEYQFSANRFHQLVMHRIHQQDPLP